MPNDTAIGGLILGFQMGLRPWTSHRTRVILESQDSALALTRLPGTSMASPRRNSPKSKQSVDAPGITRIWVRGFKSLSKEQSIEIRPLTVLAGANSSGKSSIMQPLLLMKQTLEASYDPGALLLDGSHVKFTSSDQLLSLQRNGKAAKLFRTGLETGSRLNFETEFTHQASKGFPVTRTRYKVGLADLELVPDLSDSEITKRLEPIGVKLPEGKLSVIPQRFYLTCVSRNKNSNSALVSLHFINPRFNPEPEISQVIHVSGFRRNRARTYPVAAVTGQTFPGPFDAYAASVVLRWERESNKTMLDAIASDLKRLALTSKVTAKLVYETEVELRVGRLLEPTPSGDDDLVNIADVGSGVSQSLPVLIALRVARPGQLVYIEEPEMDLHPKAQWAMAEVCAEAAKRGVRVVIETHNDLILLGVQRMVAEGKLPAERVKLHWFQRSKDGSTRIASADLDERGTFGAWPEDFDDVRLDAQKEFLDAVWHGPGKE
jgi:predicted ATPase